MRAQSFSEKGHSESKKRAQSNPEKNVDSSHLTKENGVTKKEEGTVNPKKGHSEISKKGTASNNNVKEKEIYKEKDSVADDMFGYDKPLEIANDKPTKKWLLDSYNFLRGVYAENIPKPITVSSKVAGRLNTMKGKGITKEHVENTIENLFRDKWHIDHGSKMITLEYATREDIINKYHDIR